MHACIVNSVVHVFYFNYYFFAGISFYFIGFVIFSDVFLGFLFAHFAIEGKRPIY